MPVRSRKHDASFNMVTFLFIINPFKVRTVVCRRGVYTVLLSSVVFSPTKKFETANIFSSENRSTNTEDITWSLIFTPQLSCYTD